MEYYDYGFYSFNLALTTLVITGIVFLVILPLLNTIFPIIIKGKPNNILNGELDLDTNTRSVIKRAVIGDRKIVLTRNGDVSRVKVDVIIHDGLLKPKTTYVIEFNDNNAVINLKNTPKKVSLVVLTCDGHVINKKKYGYPNEILNIVTSLGIALTTILPLVVYGFSNAQQLYDYYPLYGVVFYVLPIVIGIVFGVAHYLFVKLITSSFNFGGKK